MRIKDERLMRHITQLFKAKVLADDLNVSQEGFSRKGAWRVNRRDMTFYNRLVRPRHLLKPSFI